MKPDSKNNTPPEPSPKELSEALYLNRLILESAGEGIYGLDAEGKVTFVNAKAEKITGFTAKEMIGNCQHKLVHHSKQDGTPYPQKQCPIYAAFRDGNVHKVSNEVFWRKDGTSFPVEYVSAPIRENGKLVGAVVTFQDITEEFLIIIQRSFRPWSGHVFVLLNERFLRVFCFSKVGRFPQQKLT